MAACYVTGIAPTQDVNELETLLGGIAGVDRSKLNVITTVERSTEHDCSFLGFIHTNDDRIMTSFGGTSIPGIEIDDNRLGYMGLAHIQSRLGTLPIPEDEVDNYNDALDEGRSVVAYDCAGSDTGAIEQAFQTAGLRHVKMYSA